MWGWLDNSQCSPDMEIKRIATKIYLVHSVSLLGWRGHVPFAYYSGYINIVCLLWGFLWTQLFREMAHRADSRFAPSQWEMALLCNDISHWLGESLESSLAHVLPLIFPQIWKKCMQMQSLPKLIYDKVIWCIMLFTSFFRLRKQLHSSHLWMMFWHRA